LAKGICHENKNCVETIKLFLIWWGAKLEILNLKVINLIRTYVSIPVLFSLSPLGIIIISNSGTLSHSVYTIYLWIWDNICDWSLKSILES